MMSSPTTRKPSAENHTEVARWLYENFFSSSNIDKDIFIEEIEEALMNAYIKGDDDAKLADAAIPPHILQIDRMKKGLHQMSEDVQSMEAFFRRCMEVSNEQAQIITDLTNQNCELKNAKV